MPNYLAPTLLMLFAISARADWAPVGDPAHPNCAAKSCAVKEGGRLFEITMVTEPDGDLTYLRRLQITPRGGAPQEFNTPAVNAAEARENFKLYAVNLQDEHTTDLALRAFESGKAGTAFYYFLYDRRAKKFSQSEGTIPKLERDSKSKMLKTDVQGVVFEIKNLQLREK